MKISIIAAVAKNDAIGKDNKLLWHIKDDLQLFKKTTLNHVIIMGRKSFESIGRPLPNRTNVVITRKKDYAPEKVQVFDSLNKAFDYFRKSENEIFVIGGGEIYRQSLDNADMLHISHVEVSVEGADTFFPKINWEEWKKVSEQHFEQSPENDFAFRYCIYERS
ncbi:MAG: dihydrofolate reductase [Flavobacteriales bacterium]|nr:dihydrofolate reductase [Flavobacteriales bacterium]